MIQINLNTDFYTHAEHSPTNAIYIKYYLILKQQGKKHTKTTPKQTNKQTNKHVNAINSNHLRTYTHIYYTDLHITDTSRDGSTERKVRFSGSVFQRWQGWAVPKVLWEWIPNVGSKAGDGVKAMTLAFELLDFQHESVRRRAQCHRNERYQ